MHIISKKKLRDYYENNASAKMPLIEWYIKIKEFSPKNLHELKTKFNSVDYIHGYTIFNVGGNNYRLITAIHYNLKKCYIRNIWSHAEYSKPYNQDKLKRGDL